MKKAIVLSVLGLAAGVATTFGQGQLVFDTYSTSGPSIGGAISSGFTAALEYSLSPIVDSAGSGAIIGGLTPAYQSPDSTLSGNGLMTAGIVSTSAGWLFVGSGNNALFTLPTYSGSAPVYFEVLAYNGANYASSTIRGHSAAFATPLATGQNSPQALGLLGFSSFSVASVVPEPTTMALGGLGLAALLVARRKKA